MTDIIKNNPRKSTTLALVTAAILVVTECKTTALSSAFEAVVTYALGHPYIAAFVAISPLLAHNACKIIATKKGRFITTAITGSVVLGYLTVACAELGDANPINIEHHAKKVFDVIKSFIKAGARTQLAVTAITASAIGSCYMMYKRITNNTKRKALSLIKAGEFIQAQEIISHTIPGYFNKHEVIRLINEYQHQYNMGNDITSLYCQLEESIPS